MKDKYEDHFANRTGFHVIVGVLCIIAAVGFSRLNHDFTVVVIYLVAAALNFMNAKAVHDQRVLNRKKEEEKGND